MPARRRFKGLSCLPGGRCTFSASSWPSICSPRTQKDAQEPRFNLANSPTPRPRSTSPNPATPPPRSTGIGARYSPSKLSAMTQDALLQSRRLRGGVRPSLQPPSPSLRQRLSRGSCKQPRSRSLPSSKRVARADAVQPPADSPIVLSQTPDNLLSACDAPVLLDRLDELELTFHRQLAAWAAMMVDLANVCLERQLKTGPGSLVESEKECGRNVNSAIEPDINDLIKDVGSLKTKLLQELDKKPVHKVAGVE